MLFKDGDYSPSRIVVIGMSDIYPPDAIKRRFGEWPINSDDFVIKLKAFRAYTKIISIGRQFGLG